MPPASAAPNTSACDACVHAKSDKHMWPRSRLQRLQAAPAGGLQKARERAWL